MKFGPSIQKFGYILSNIIFNNLIYICKFCFIEKRKKFSRMAHLLFQIYRSNYHNFILELCIDQLPSILTFDYENLVYFKTCLICEDTSTFRATSSFEIFRIRFKDSKWIRLFRWLVKVIE